VVQVNLNPLLTEDRSEGNLMSIRDTRLENDCRSLEKFCSLHESEKVQIFEKRGQPPDFYRVQISNCKGIEAVKNDRVVYRIEHILIISDFPANYPLLGNLPCFKMETPIFHPNVYYNGLIELCLSIMPGKTYWSLDYLVKIVIGMIQYENLNWGMHANLAARDWVNRNKHQFPLNADKNCNKLFSI
jgi:ubiquitin-protein ligase